MPPVVSATLPGSLLERFAGDARTRLLHALRFLTPLTTRGGPRRAGSAMAGGDPQTMPLVPGRRRS